MWRACTPLCSHQHQRAVYSAVCSTSSACAALLSRQTTVQSQGLLCGHPALTASACTQVQAYIQGSAVSGVVQGALEGLGTVNRLLQTELTQVPNVIITPAQLQPVVLFASTFAVSNTQDILLNNTGNATVEFGVRPSRCADCQTLPQAGRCRDELLQSWHPYMHAGRRNAKWADWRLDRGSACKRHHPSRQGAQCQPAVQYQPELLPGRLRSQRAHHHKRSSCCPGELSLS